MLLSAPTLAAEQITLSYGIFKRSISIDSLKTFAKTGELDQNLTNYTHHIDPEHLLQMQQVLQARIALDASQISQYLQTPIGEQFLSNLATLIQSDTPQSLISDLRVAIIRAATDPEGLILLNILRQFPHDRLEVDVARCLQLVTALEQFADQTNQAIAQINQQSSQEAATQPLPKNLALTEPFQKGRFTWEQYPIVLKDRSRNRTLPIDFYLPHSQNSRPLIIISHGLGSNGFNFIYLAQHLASHGFAVAVPEHSGSNWDTLRALFDSKTKYVMQPSEFIDRPLDVSYLLDELQDLTQTHPTFRRRLNLQQVGIIGQSFGGYTAFILAGASPHFDQLKVDCQALQNFLNLSLLLQCRALVLQQMNSNFADPRIKAAIAINPIGRHILTPESFQKIRIPTLIVASSGDILAPIVLEQIQPFTWLSTPHKHFALINGGTHFSSVEYASDQLFSSLTDTKHDPAITRRYVLALSTAFFQTYVSQQESYRPYLSAAYADRISENDAQLSLVQSIVVSRLTEVSHDSTLSRLILPISMAQAVGIVCLLAVRKRFTSHN